MNVWTDIAIGNLLRYRGPPLDIDIETMEVVEQEMFVCPGPACGILKPASDYYYKPDKRTNTSRRQKLCKSCMRVAAKIARQSVPKEKRPIARELILLELTRPMSLRDLYDSFGMSRRPVNRALDNLVRDGLVRQCGFGTLGTNSRIPLYELSLNFQEATQWTPQRAA